MNYFLIFDLRVSRNSYSKPGRSEMAEVRKGRLTGNANFASLTGTQRKKGKKSATPDSLGTNSIPYKQWPPPHHFLALSPGFCPSSYAFVPPLSIGAVPLGLWPAPQQFSVGIRSCGLECSLGHFPIP